MRWNKEWDMYIEDLEISDQSSNIFEIAKRFEISFQDAIEADVNIASDEYISWWDVTGHQENIFMQVLAIVTDRILGKGSKLAYLKGYFTRLDEMVKNYKS